ncbi:MAG TPA: GNAT family N-acetyltransferase [Solirubrobacteraceae bacterium]|nr:GNAT family N-acetyltransferase [Solirubrobacteraceae bacterium]
MRFVLTRDPGEFAARTERLLLERIECNVLATVLMNVLDGAYADSRAVLCYGVGDGDEVLFAALRTPPHPLIASPLEGSATALVDVWLQADPGLDRVTSVPDTARAIAAAWRKRTGGTPRRAMREAMHILDEVRDPPRPAAGELRLADAADRSLLVGWMRDFIVEAGISGATQAGSMVDARMRRDGLLVWDDEQPVSMVGVTPPVAGVVRLGPVYTPPPQRRRGYAGAAVAATSRRALAHGAERCMLYTDLDNPTSNKIYAEVGYRRSSDWEEIALESAAG